MKYRVEPVTKFQKSRFDWFALRPFLSGFNFLILYTMNQLRKATRQKAKIRLGLSAVSGGGKTYSALLIAKGLSGGDLSKVAMIDTENGSGDLYANLGDYNVLSLDAPYTPERYISAIKECENAGMNVIIIDSITHEWDGKGGCLEIQSQLGGKYQDWAKVTPRHQSFIDAILQSSCHIITTVRRKQDYEMTKDGNGRLQVQKAGLKEMTREGFEYELTANLELDTKHNATASKDRTELFAGQPEFVPSEQTGKMLLDWCEKGVQPKTAKEIQEEIRLSLTSAKTLKDLGDAYLTLSEDNKLLWKEFVTKLKAALEPKKAEEKVKPEKEPDGKQ